MKAYTKYSMTIAKEKLEKNFLNNLQSLFLKDDSILSKDNVSELKWYPAFRIVTNKK